MCRVVLVHAAGGGFWASCIRHIQLSLPQFQILKRWCLLRALFCAASTRAPGGGNFSDDTSSSAPSLTTLIFSFFSFHVIHPANSFMGDCFPSDSTPDGSLCSCTCVEHHLVVGCSSLLGLFVCHLIPHYPTVAWAPSEGYLVPFIMEGSKEA